MKPRSIAWQLIINAIIPVFAALIVLAVVNYRHTQLIQNKSFDEKRNIISNEIKHIFVMQDISLELLEHNLQEQMRAWSELIVNYYLRKTRNPMKLDLASIHKELGMDSLVDIYVIDRNGIIITTTYEKDLGLNMFSFGESHKAYLLDVFDKGEFVSERFATEASTFRFKKYSYQPSLDKKYIVELGSYSPKLNKVISAVNNALNDISELQEGISNVELFIVTDTPFSMNSNRKATDKEALIIKQVFETGANYIEEQQTFNSRTTYEDYSVIEWKSSGLYKGAVLRITSDRETIRAVLGNELQRTASIFGIVTLVVALLIYRQTQRLTKPIKNLADKVQTISEGNLKERVAVEGNNEITQLSHRFNMMIGKLDDYYQTLEDKVKHRTEALEKSNHQIIKQRDKLRSQNSRIRSSIQYAKSIQNAVLPARDVIDSEFDNFILYRPKDIVSGDSYWMYRIPNPAADVDKSIVFAAIDCTGHGVPGAFMSVIADRLLNSIVSEQGIYQPHRILHELDEGVRATLRQDQTTNDDGMDMVLLRLDYRKDGAIQVVFSGAKRPLFYYSRLNGSIWTKKGSIRSIGGNRYDLNEDYEDTVVWGDPGDLIYIGSDGITDQPNKRRKKFGTARLFSLLISNATLPLTEQLEAIESELDEHISGVEQYDDITLIGLRV